MKPVRVYIDKVAGQIVHYDPQTGVTTVVASASEGLTVAQLKQRMINMNLRLR